MVTDCVGYLIVNDNWCLATKKEIEKIESKRKEYESHIKRAGKND